MLNTKDPPQPNSESFQTVCTLLDVGDVLPRAFLYSSLDILLLCVDKSEIFGWMDFSFELIWPLLHVYVILNLTNFM